ncbi:acyltransferase family protein [Bradyrhizobium sp. th.b2]|uniref:acyltransferase family protein n=1 Tax=Bradyrhizobium sp. th-b2 TaxID=172088 RepID=UPI0012EB47B9|nr:acyltransferase family protein [Bradyrhizobium sp. th.b2]
MKIEVCGAPIGDAAKQFRFDINALRALSVMAVLGYHLKIPGFAGGFIGVDAFFVVTGYLMIGKVVAGLISGRFSYADFAMMRLRRIYPALLLVVVATAAAGWFLTLPGEYFRHIRQACYALFFLSNFAFDNDNGYFAMAAQTKPLLHTWSLAVEWQFYIWMPLVVRLVWSRCLRSNALAATMTALTAVAVASLAWCLWENQHDAMGSAFFSLRARAWEPLAGGIIAVAEVWRRENGRAALSKSSGFAAASVGWILTAICVAYPLPETRWPGALTILPILGATLVVAGGLQTLKLIQSPIVQHIGDWSYSIYLWHWPIWVLAGGWLTVRGYDVDPVSKALMVAASIAIGATSYYLVEQPVRLRRDVWTPRRLLAGTGAIVATFVAFTIGALLTTGFPGRLPVYLLPAEMARKTDTPRDECFRNANSVKAAGETYCTFGGGKAADHAAVMLWGDSFANQYLEPISTAATKLGLAGLIATQSACRPFVDDPDRNAADSPPCRQFNSSTLQFLSKRAEPSIVVLAGNWSSAAEISPLVETLLSSGKTVVLVMPLLRIGFDVPQKWIESQIRAGKSIPEWKVPADPTLTMQALRREVTEILAPHKDDGRLILIDPQKEVCDASYCYLVQAGQANFRDTAHISNVNAQKYEREFAAALGLAGRLSHLE